MNKDQRDFYEALKTVSIAIAAWAKGQFELGCSVAEIKQRLKNVAKVAERH